MLGLGVWCCWAGVGSSGDGAHPGTAGARSGWRRCCERALTTGVVSGAGTAFRHVVDRIAHTKYVVEGVRFDGPCVAALSDQH